ncbi:MAG: type II toxin-antitoxin system RelE/ParE family toxin [Gammaproteobacteria bacterium]|nr:type II toxin-antitoxin system RelE/ParE family toxin [Gammaproteobacteria bacterium]
MIRSFRDRESRKVAEGRVSRAFPANIQRRAKMRLDRLHAATRLADLRMPPSHRLEVLKGARRGQHSIRINDQWRICFEWRDGHAWNVEITDYH